MNTESLVVVGIGSLQLLSGLGFLLCELAVAPEGYEDGDGFHYGPEPAPSDAEPRMDCAA